MTELGTRARHSRRARAFTLAVGVAFVVALPVQAASAQLLPDDPCLTDPAGCLPDTPLDPCLADPEACLPETPVDPCLADPASCLPDTPVDPCIENPTSCLPDTDPDPCDQRSPCVPALPELQGCTDDPARCVQPGDGDDREDRDDGDQAGPPAGGSAPPDGRDAGRGDGGDTPGSPGAGAGTGQDRSADDATTAGTTPDGGVPELRAGGILDRIGDGLADAARSFAFPLALAVMVIAFLLVQGRIDRGDPKLAAAPVDARDDVVMFR